LSDALAAQRAGLDPLIADPLGLDAVPGVRADIDAPDLIPALPGDHRLGGITLGARTLGVDASGCYRLR
jgi:hypothetical protein